ncbi:magnesium citrate secondary transporter [Botryobacter ruber]|uniref:magnesium citrate secondary transporter n=1 Tax=Botryobacter ruber TaxID=2171629 RepID=UPI000E0B3449|nr:magnesium citrate secondary transporter [Botryobacter ruber]
MQTLRHPFFLLCFVLFCLNQLLELAGRHIWPLHAYLDDLLCMPVVLTLALAAERVYFKNPGFVLPVAYVAGAVAAFAVIFELLLPLLTTKHTADLPDVLLYGLGAFAFQALLNKPLHE